MKRLAIGLSTLLLAFATAGTAFAQQADLVATPVDPAGHPELTTVVTAPAGFGEDPLAVEDITVTVDGEPVEELAIDALPVEALDVMVVVDTSGSMSGEPMAGAKQAATAFIDRIEGAGRIGLVAFGDTATLVEPPTEEAGRVRNAIASLEASGETALYDGMRLAAESLSGAEGSSPVVVAVTDGGDTVSSSALETAANELADTNAAVYAIGLESPEQDFDSLEQLVEPSDGTVVSAADSEALAAAYDAIANEVVRQYELSFETEAFGASEVTIVVERGDVSASVTQEVALPQPPPPPVPEPEPAAPPVLEGSVVVTPWYATTAALIAGLALVYLALAGIILIASGRRQKPTELTGAATRVRRQRPTQLSNLTNASVAFADQLLERSHKRGPLASRLERAAVALRPGEYLVVLAGATSLSFAFGFVFGSFVIGLLMATAAAVIGHVVIEVRVRRRQQAFSDQLSDVLQLLSSALRSGYSLLQAVDAVASEADAPAADELQRVVIETRLGRDLTTTLMAAADRLDSEDFRWVVQAIDIHRNVGGDLAEVLDNVSTTIRDRSALKRQVKTLSTEGRLSAYILIGIPFFLMAGLGAINPEYMGELFTTAPGLVMLAIGGVLMAIGSVWIMRIVRLDF